MIRSKEASNVLEDIPVVDVAIVKAPIGCIAF